MDSIQQLKIQINVTVGNELFNNRDLDEARQAAAEILQPFVFRANGMTIAEVKPDRKAATLEAFARKEIKTLFARAGITY